LWRRCPLSPGGFVQPELKRSRPVPRSSFRRPARTHRTARVSGSTAAAGSPTPRTRIGTRSRRLRRSRRKASAVWPGDSPLRSPRDELFLRAQRV